ncbi:inter-alpha-trypsin inhibitor heavy chain H3-like [Glandiceps talaboti]
MEWVIHTTVLVFWFTIFSCHEIQGRNINIVVPGDHGLAANIKRHRREAIDEEKKPEIYSLSVKSAIASRFANTIVTSKIHNGASTAREAVFTVQLPDSAFIANFSMEIDGEVYVGEVKEKVKAEKEYKKAKQRGQTAGHVSSKPRATNTFKVAINVAAGTKLTFELTYQEMLQRRLGLYEHRISIRPGQIVKRIKVDVYIIEPQGLEFIYVPQIVTNVVDSWNLSPTSDSPATITQESDSRAHVSYSPTEDEQRAQSPEGIMGDLIIRYDVKHDTSAGQIQVLDGYFVHYFAPSNLPPVQKNVVFIIDVSGSMDGTKLKQTKDALKTILDEMRSFDRFNILTFSSGVSFWQENTMVLATAENVREAKSYINGLRADGGTDFNSGLVQGVEMLRGVTDDAENTERSAYLIIMLTDGHPTSGVTILKDIQETAKEVIRGQYSLFCLGFGNDVDFNFLKKISLENEGIGRRIYEDSDATLQLKGFYDEVATPLLFDVDIQYPSENVDPNSVTQSSFKNYFNGSELVVAGKLSDDTINNLKTRVLANGADSELEFLTEVDPQETPSSLLSKHVPADFVQRLWAYLTIKEILRKRVLTEDVTEKEALSQRALDLSLKYNFVTPLTSMLVVKPEEPEINKAEGETEEGGGAVDKDSGGNTPTTPRPQPSRRKHKSRTSGRTSSGGGRGFAYGDPHFVVELPGDNHTICFNINGKEDDIFTLVSDPINGIQVNAKLIADTKDETKTKQGTYIGEVGIVVNFGKSSYHIRATPDYVTIDKSHQLPWKPMKIQFRHWTLQINHNSTLVFTYGDDISMVLHLVKRRAPINDYFGFYIEDGLGFSDKVHGLIGQFHRGMVSIENEEVDIFDPMYLQAEARVGQRRVPVFENFRKNEKSNERVRCWFAHNNARGVIDGDRTSYLVKELFNSSFSPP